MTLPCLSSPWALCSIISLGCQRKPWRCYSRIRFVLRDSPDARSAGPNLVPLTLSLCRTVTHRLSPGRSLPQSGQICPPAPLPPAVRRKHTGTASQNHKTRIQPTPNHYGELVPLPGHLKHCPGLFYKPFQLLIVSRQGSQTGFVIPTPLSAQTDAQTAQPQKETAELPSTAWTLRTRSTTVIALEAIWTFTRAGMPPG